MFATESKYHRCLVSFYNKVRMNVYKEGRKEDPENMVNSIVLAILSTCIGVHDTGKT